jgi:hypothetical protein
MSATTWTTRCPKCNSCLSQNKAGKLCAHCQAEADDIPPGSITITAAELKTVQHALRLAIVCEETSVEAFTSPYPEVSEQWSEHRKASQGYVRKFKRLLAKLVKPRKERTP